MVLPSLVDAAVVVVLLVPGSVTFITIRKFAALERKLSEIETIIWSVFLSIVVLLPFGLITGLTDIDKIRDGIFVHYNLAVLATLIFSIGTVVGVGYKRFFRKGIVPGEPWHIAFRIIGKSKRERSYAIVYTTTNLEYKGQVHYAGEYEQQKELILYAPVQIFRDEKRHIVEQMEVGKEMLFTEKDVSRIAFYDKLE